MDESEKEFESQRNDLDK
jgi:chromosome segregation ATPase